MIGDWKYWVTALWVGCLAAGVAVLWVWPAGVAIWGLPDVELRQRANVMVAVTVLASVLSVVVWRHRVLE